MVIVSFLLFIISELTVEKLGQIDLAGNFAKIPPVSSLALMIALISKCYLLLESRCHGQCVTLLSAEFDSTFDLTH
jgi:hypothetical protein